jgi:hypothetical protein
MTKRPKINRNDFPLSLAGQLQYVQAVIMRAWDVKARKLPAYTVFAETGVGRLLNIINAADGQRPTDPELVQVQFKLAREGCAVRCAQVETGPYGMRITARDTAGNVLTAVADVKQDSPAGLSFEPAVASIERGVGLLGLPLTNDIERTDFTLDLHGLVQFVQANVRHQWRIPLRAQQYLAYEAIGETTDGGLGGLAIGGPNPPDPGRAVQVQHRFAIPGWHARYAEIFEAWMAPSDGSLPTLTPPPDPAQYRVLVIRACDRAGNVLITTARIETDQDGTHRKANK